jgi:hypothetical protein
VVKKLKDHLATGPESFKFPWKPKNLIFRHTEEIKCKITLKIRKEEIMSLKVS